jgi:hypothetical protein
MTLFIQNDVGGAGAGGVNPANATADLMQIGNVANNDSVYGENPPAAGSDLIQVTYVLNTATGPCPARLNNLVNTNFGVNAANIDIIIIAADSSFTLLDGTMITSAAGVTLPVGSADNPTNSVMVIYDTSQANGVGYCVKGEASGNFDTGDPNAVILYHELSHALRDATSSSLDNTPPSACGASPEENAAEIDENDMRDQMGVPHRDATDHCGQPGCPTNCCIVATISSGSAYSPEVNALRQVRDRVLRQSNVGFEFFDQLHYDYYNFSPQICRMMAMSPVLLRQIDVFFVKPLTLCLGLMQDYTLGGCAAQELGERFERGLQTSPELLALSNEELEKGLVVLRTGTQQLGAMEPAWEAIGRLLEERAYSSQYVRWALVDPVTIYAQAMKSRNQGTSPAETGRQLAASFDRWSVDLPLTDGWRTMSQYAIREELNFLKKALFREPTARKQFASRLLCHLGRDQSVERLLVEAEYLPERTSA